MEEVRTASENYRAQLKERIEKKMETMQGNRDSQLKQILERLEEHVRNLHLTGGRAVSWGITFILTVIAKFLSENIRA